MLPHQPQHPVPPSALIGAAEAAGVPAPPPPPLPKVEHEASGALRSPSDPQHTASSWAARGAQPDHKDCEPLTDSAVPCCAVPACLPAALLPARLPAS